MADAALIKDAVRRAEQCSPYLRGLIRRFPDISSGQHWRSGLVPLIAPDCSVGEALRVAKGQLALATALGDLAGLLSLNDVMSALSSFADAALEIGRAHV